MMLKYLSLISVLICLITRVDIFTNGYLIKDQEVRKDNSFVYKSKHETHRITTPTTTTKLRMTRDLNNIQEIEFKKEEEMPQFVEHPTDSLILGKSTVQIQCTARYAERVHFECANKVREDVKRNITIKENIKYESLSLSLRKKDLETKNSFNSFGLSKKMMCKCVAFSKNNEKILSNKALIKNSYLEEDFQSEPMDEVAYIGDTVEMRCDPPRGEPTPVVYWLKNNQEINTNSDSSRYKLSNDFSLLILVAMPDDADNYVCVATNQYDKRSSKPARLTLIDSAKKYIWSEWSEWSDCPPVKCGQLSLSKRYRNCQTIDKLSQLQNVSTSLCGSGGSVEDKTCDIKPCPVESHWSQWSQWSTCTNECKQYKRRFCNSIDNQNCFGEKQTSRNCDLNKCIISKPKLEMLPNEKTKITPTTTKSYLTDLKLDNVHLTIALLSTVLLLIFIIGLIIFYYKRKSIQQEKRRRSEINLYYTCEKQMPAEDACSIFKFTKNICSNGSTSSSASSTSSSAPAIRHEPKPRIFENMFERAELITNDKIYHGTNLERQLLLEQQLQKNHFNSQHKNHFLNHHNLELSKNSPFKPLSTTTTSSSSSSSSSSNLKTTPVASYMTKTSMLSSSSPTSNIYYEASNYKLNSPNSFNSNYNDLDKIVLKSQINHQPNYMNLNSHTDIIYQQSRDEELAYEVADALNIITSDRLVNLPAYIDSNDICIGRVGSSGAKLTLQCGISLIIPEGALALDQQVTMYLALNRLENHKPKLNEKTTLLSEIVLIGPQYITLLKPVILVMEHCVKNINQDWLIHLHSAFNSVEHMPEWREDTNITSDNSTNLNVFLNATECNFLLMTDKLGRYALTGEQNKSKNSKASKDFRLISFCSSCITNNEFNLRIYCVDNLLSALQEVLNDELKIGGTLLETSEPFALVSCINQTESLTVCIDELEPESLNCKYNVNQQEIPMNHIWNERNHLLHCSFTLELNDSLNEHFKCRINAYRSTQADLNVNMNINYNLKNLLYLKTNELNESLSKRLVDLDMSGCWPKSSKLIQTQNQIKSYNKIERNLKKKICVILDETINHEKNWRMLAKTLAINRNLNYFASKTSPTDMLLLYFEAISDLKANDLSKSEQTTPIKQSSTAAAAATAATFVCLSNENLYVRTFLNNFIETLKINEDLVKLIYTEKD